MSGISLVVIYLRFALLVSPPFRSELRILLSRQSIEF